MNHLNRPSNLNRLFSDYGMLLVLLGLCLFFTLLTITEQHLEGEEAALALHKNVMGLSSNKTILIVASGNAEGIAFATLLKSQVASSDGELIGSIVGSPAEVRAGLDSILSLEIIPDLFLTTHSLAASVNLITGQYEQLAHTSIIEPPPDNWPTFLLPENLRNVANQITVIAIIAIGMTMVIITAGIDLSVGSLIALSAVVVAWIVGRLGGEGATAGTMILAGLGGIILSGAIGAFSGLMITGFRIPPFIATLAMMQVAAGLAYIVSHGKPIYQLPENFVWLGRGADPWLNLPIAVLLMLFLYALAHLVMTRTTWGRYIYAVGGNMEAARLSGIRVNRVLMAVYTVCGMLAGLGGLIMASQLKSGAPTYGLTYELYVIAAVVVGGTSLMGGEGRIIGTLIGAFIIAVIQNGMNLTNVESYTQKVVLGLVILGAVLLDRLKHRKRKRKLPQVQKGPVVKS